MVEVPVRQEHPAYILLLGRGEGTSKTSGVYGQFFVYKKTGVTGITTLQRVGAQNASLHPGRSMSFSTAGHYPYSTHQGLLTLEESAVKVTESEGVRCGDQLGVCSETKVAACATDLLRRVGYGNRDACTLARCVRMSRTYRGVWDQLILLKPAEMHFRECLSRFRSIKVSGLSCFFTVLPHLQSQDT